MLAGAFVYTGAGASMRGLFVVDSFVCVLPGLCLLVPVTNAFAAKMVNKLTWIVRVIWVGGVPLRPLWLGDLQARLDSGPLAICLPVSWLLCYLR